MSEGVREWPGEGRLPGAGRRDLRAAQRPRDPGEPRFRPGRLRGPRQRRRHGDGPRPYALDPHPALHPRGPRLVRGLRHHPGDGPGPHPRRPGGRGLPGPRLPPGTPSGCRPGLRVAAGRRPGADRRTAGGGDGRRGPDRRPARRRGAGRHGPLPGVRRGTRRGERLAARHGGVRAARGSRRRRGRPARAGVRHPVGGRGPVRAHGPLGGGPRHGGRPRCPDPGRPGPAALPRGARPGDDGGGTAAFGGRADRDRRPRRGPPGSGGAGRRLAGGTVRRPRGLRGIPLRPGHRLVGHRPLPAPRRPAPHPGHRTRPGRPHPAGPGPRGTRPYRGGVPRPCGPGEPYGLRTGHPPPDALLPTRPGSAADRPRPQRRRGPAAAAHGAQGRAAV